MICPLCPESLTLSSLKIHLKSIHGKIVKGLKCKQGGCFRTFSNLNSFMSHIKKSNHFGQCENNSVVVDDPVIDPDIVDEVHEVPSVPNSDNALPNESVCSLEDVISGSADLFIANLYSNPSIPRSIIQTLVEDTSVFMNSCIQSSFKTDIFKILHDCNASTEQLQNVTEMFKSLKEPFFHLATEYKRSKYFQKLGCLVLPEVCQVGDAEVVSIPLKHVLKKIIELPDVFDTICSYISSLSNNDDRIENIMQCPLWQSKRSKYAESDIVLPLNVFIDGFECNNPLGSHSLTLDGVYTSLPCLPPEFQTAMENIFLAQIYPASIRKEVTDDKVFAPLISQLTFLEKEGILVKTPDGEKKIYIVTALLLGDNKGLQSVSGFMEGFTANYFCRFCKTQKNVTYTQTVQDDTMLRTRESYDEDVLVNNSEVTGVHFDSAFNKIPSFHVTSNLVVDHFHDFAEGIAHYVLLHVLRHCIPRYFTLDDLNHRILMFDYGSRELSNKIPLISSNFATRDKLKMSGSETLSFVRFFGLLIGDRVPEHDSHWRLYLKLRQLLDEVLAKSLCKKKAVTLKVLAEEFNAMYVSVTGDTLKPKMHFLVHYAMVFANSGILDQMSTKRYESKHRSLTIPARTTMSRVKISYTCALRHQLAQSFRFYAKKPLLSPVEVGTSDLVFLNDIENVNYFRNNLPECLSSEELILCADWVKISGIVYKPGMVLVASVHESGPIFAEIQSILVKDAVVVFIYRYFLSLGFNEHYYAHCVAYSDRWSCKQHNDIFDPFPLYVHEDISGEKYVVLRYSL